ncbi:MAG: hypothetical protein A3F95_00575 [Candidatus Nealsonbacteria bacterium RIFCSPLOWO2_12_FULL_39_31]|uniref:Large ribosomal subunit protein bL25 n=3 Tax=Candidatus Nealsoniibacteriota TaxID=1817911 RepID=A0A1G2EEU5_9BACT|nr:MAG: 50S ribosomal protein L25 [Parcubacteria group bacterium GW2011_GWA2_38_27]OGZ20280.1 MAG: hypothetical protein A2626_01430 [Candidatus Nealsonbacteria bacterium RIFCSPHIGHO2_01_FULL_38_55]OGZ20851.1 MAG: hypothetical protein A2W55_00610 [Candidatus Nealsonbacteria bacterium RIFCSPHIGHO2_02_38_10]OGZ21818.1 MAG: hypothetical protein A3C48_01190 [Candidatus Nealsonbacteria bacterium RIFCSPHIGHO2_02_FULL_38_75]OGZ22503.1 MAG: hypothetical protein A2981_01080 [Candidatus Nealsonbacteria ba
MLDFSVERREKLRKKVKDLRKKGITPAVLYGPEIKNLLLEVNLKNFKNILKKAGESSLINLKIEGGKEKFLVLIHQIKKNPISGAPIHIDFYQPILSKEIEVVVPLIFEGEAPVLKDMGGTLIKEIYELKVRALPKNLPHEITVDISKLKKFEDEILIKDLILPEGVKTHRGPDEIVVLAVPPAKVEEELAKQVEEKVEDVEQVKKKKAEESAAEVKAETKEPK